jgi:hypothetical protein
LVIIGSDPWASVTESVVLPPRSEWSGDMPDREVLLQARDLRARAEEIRTQAETFRNADIREKLREVAVRYDQLAKRLEERAGD